MKSSFFFHSPEAQKGLMSFTFGHTHSGIVGTKFQELLSLSHFPPIHESPSTSIFIILIHVNTFAFASLFLKEIKQCIWCIHKQLQKLFVQINHDFLTQREKPQESHLFLHKHCIIIIGRSRTNNKLYNIQLNIHLKQPIVFLKALFGSKTPFVRVKWRIWCRVVVFR